VIWSWEGLLSTEGEEIQQITKEAFEKSYDTDMWVNWWRWGSIPSKGKFYSSGVWKANTSRWRSQSYDWTLYHPSIAHSAVNESLR